MKKTLSIEYTHISQDDHKAEYDLYQQSILAAKNAYSPYSNFKVGAAILLEDDNIVTGNNQENAAYPSGMCAERIAIYHTGAMYPGKIIKAIAVSAISQHNKLTHVTPCGACRQAMLEYEVKQQQHIPIIMMNEQGQLIKIHSIQSLLPFSFTSCQLK